MPTIRIWVSAAAAALLIALPSSPVQARDCERYPALCEPTVEAKPTTDPAPRAAPVKKSKARVAKRPEKASAAAKPTAAKPTAAKPSRAATQQQPTEPISHEPPAPPVSHEPTVSRVRGITTLDAAVTQPQSLAEAADALAMDRRGDGPALAAAGGVPIAVPTADANNGADTETAFAEDAGAGTALATVRLVDPNELNEIDLAATEQPPADTPWLRYLLATMGAAMAAASTLRYLFV